MNGTLLPIFSMSLALMGCGTVPKFAFDKANPIEPQKRDFVIETKGNVVDGPCPLGEIIARVRADGLVPSSLENPDKLAQPSIERPMKEGKNCAQSTAAIKVKSGDTAIIETDTNKHLKIVKPFFGKHPRIIKFGTVLDGDCQLGYVLVQMRYRDDPNHSPLVQYFVEPPWSVRCLPVKQTVEANPKSKVSLGILNMKGDFGVVRVISAKVVKWQYRQLPTGFYHSNPSVLDTESAGSE